MSYAPFPLATDSQAVAESMVAALQARGEVVDEASPVAALVEVFAERHVDTRALVVLEADRAFGLFGAYIVQLAPGLGVGASALTTWATSSPVATVVPQGTTVTFAGSPDLFELVADLQVPAGQATTAGVEVRAREAGARLNGVPAGPMTRPGLASVTSVTATSATSGGVDPETADEYRDRLVADRRLASRAAIVAADFAALAVDDVQVHRAVGLARYDPGQAPPDGRNGHVTVALADAQGSPVPQSAKDRVAAMFDAARVVNRVPHLIDATYTQVTVAFSFVPDPSADPAAVRVGAEQRVRDLIDPALWAGGRETPPVWRDDRLVRREDVVVAVRSTPGVDHTTSVTLNGGTADLVLAGPAALPAPFGAAAPSSVTGTAVPA